MLLPLLMNNLMSVAAVAALPVGLITMSLENNGITVSLKNNEMVISIQSSGMEIT